MLNLIFQLVLELAKRVNYMFVIVGTVEFKYLILLSSLSDHLESMEVEKGGLTFQQM